MNLNFINKVNSLMNNSKMGKKLLILYTVGFLFPILLVTVLLFLWLYRTLERWQIVQAETFLEHTAMMYEKIIEGTESLSDSLYINKRVQETLATEFLDRKEVYDRFLELDFLDDFLRSGNNLSSFKYYTENKTLLNNAYFSQVSPELLNSLWYNTVKESKGNIFWMVQKDKITQQNILTMARPVRSTNDGSYLGILCITLDSDIIRRMLFTEGKSKYNQQLFFLVDGEIAFWSDMEPENLELNDTMQESLGREGVSVVKTKWNKSRYSVLMRTLRMQNGHSLALAQFISRSQIFKAVFGGIFVFLIIIVSGAMLSAVIIQTFGRYFDTRIYHLKKEIDKVIQNDFELGEGLEGDDEFTDVHRALEFTTSSIRTLISEVYQNKIEQEKLIARQNDIRFKMLANQINPHFLFNTLETIRMLALADGSRDAAKTIKLLAKILRHNLDVSDRPVLIEREIEAVGNYLDIQHLRFQDQVSYEIKFLCPVAGIGILPLLIQPIVENSFSHGLAKREPGGLISIIIYSDDDSNLKIKISDNGCGMSMEKLEDIRKRLETDDVEKISSSIGMVNVNQRIKLFYGKQYGLEIESVQGSGTTMILTVPKVYIHAEVLDEQGFVESSDSR